jgi:hypothetical protein
VIKVSEVKVKHAGGRPSSYKPEYIKEILEYFDIDSTKIVLDKTITKNGESVKEREVSNKLPTIEGFCKKIKIAKSTLHEWVKEHEEFSNAYKKCKDMQLAIWQENSLKGLYNPAFAIFFGKNCFGWVDKQEVVSTNTNVQSSMSDDEINKKLEELINKVK